MKIQFLNGGLANQAFQYIFARYYELSHPGEKMYMDDSYFALHTVHNGYELEKVFGIKADMLSQCFTKPVWDFILSERAKGKSVPQVLMENGVEICMMSEVAENYKTFNPFDGMVYSVSCNEYVPEILDMELGENIYYHGYWINKKWFEKFEGELQKEFCFPEITDEQNRFYRDQICSSNSVSIHIRRGDYVSLGLALGAAHYESCIKQFLELAPGKWHVFVFSDDIAWCKENEKELGIRLFQNYSYVEGNKGSRSYVDMQLMAMCEGMIVSNSAFCFLAGLLNTRKKYVLTMETRAVL